MDRIEKKVSEVLRFFESQEGRDFWNRNRDEKGMCWTDNVVNLCLKASYPAGIEELESMIGKVQDILVDQGIVRIAA